MFKMVNYKTKLRLIST